jgi:hypothetical protein
MPLTPQPTRDTTISRPTLFISTWTMGIAVLVAVSADWPSSPSAWQPNHGRGSTYRRGKSVQTTGTTSLPPTKEGRMQAFQQHRRRIERAASAKFDRGDSTLVGTIEARQRISRAPQRMGSLRVSR